MSTALATIDPTALAAVRDMADIFVRSGFFSNIRSAEQACVKIMAGQELGIAPFQSMRQIHIWGNGAIQIGYQIIGTKIKQHPRYDYQVVETTTERAAIAFYQVAHSGEGWMKLGVSVFTRQDAQAMGLLTKDNWKKGPQIMLFARAMSQGANMFCPDVMGGAIYAEGDDFDDDSPRQTTVPTPTVDRKPQASKADKMAAMLNGDTPEEPPQTRSQAAPKSAPKGSRKKPQEPPEEPDAVEAGTPEGGALFAEFHDEARKLYRDDADLIDATREVMTQLGFGRDAIDFAARTCALSSEDVEAVLMALESRKG